jgi:hypothetical protein
MKTIGLTFLVVVLVAVAIICLIGWVAVDIASIADREEKEIREDDANP